MKTRHLLSIAATALLLPVLGLTGCSQTIAPNATCAGDTIETSNDTLCVLGASQMPVTNAESEVFLMDAAAVLRGWVSTSPWASLDISAICETSGFSEATTRGDLLVCSSLTTWDEATERRILASAFDGDAEPSDETDTWTQACSDWCDSACTDNIDFDGECESGCAYGIAFVSADAGPSCSDAIVDLYNCESASGCDFSNGDNCDAEVTAVNDACWTCAADADCAEGSLCADGVCELEDACVTMICEEGNVCTNGECIEIAQDDTDGDGVVDELDNCPTTVNPDQADANENGVGDACEGETCATTLCAEGYMCLDDECVDACAAIDCMDGHTCSLGVCSPINTCEGDSSYANDWLADAIDADLSALFPTDYSPTSGQFTGDDSYGFQKRSGDDSVVFQIELGPGAGFEASTYAAFPTAAEAGYDSMQNLVSVTDCSEGALYTRTGDGSFRDMEGLIVWEADGVIRDVLFVSYASASESDVLDIASTISAQ